jgi:hypothetical protein
VKHLIRTISVASATAAAGLALNAGTAGAVEVLLREHLLAELRRGGKAADGLLALVDAHILPDNADTQ